MTPLFPRWESFCNANPGLVVTVYWLAFVGISGGLAWQLAKLAARVAALEACE